MFPERGLGEIILGLLLMALSWGYYFLFFLRFAFLLHFFDVFFTLLLPLLGSWGIIDLLSGSLGLILFKFLF